MVVFYKNAIFTPLLLFLYGFLQKYTHFFHLARFFKFMEYITKPTTWRIYFWQDFFCARICKERIYRVKKESSAAISLHSDTNNLYISIPHDKSKHILDATYIRKNSCGIKRTRAFVPEICAFEYYVYRSWKRKTMLFNGIQVPSLSTSHLILK